MTNLYYVETSLLISDIIMRNRLAWAFVIIVLIVAVSFIIITNSITANIVGEVKEPINMGVIIPLTKATVTAYEQVREGIDMAADDINALGGINGHSLKLIYEDDQCDARMAVTAFEKLVNIDKVSIIIGPACSSNVLAVAPLANEKKIIILTTVGSTDKITTSGDYVFRNTPTARDYSYYIAEFAYRNLSARTASVLYLNLDNGIDFKDAFVKRFVEVGGTILNTESYERGENDFRAQLIKIKSQNPNVLFIAGQINQGLAMKQARELGIDKQIIGPVTVENADIFAQAGSAAEGVIYSAPKFDKNNPTVKAFEEKYKVKYNKILGVRTAIAYDAVMIIASLLKKCGEDVECIKNELYATKNYQGVSGLTSFDENGDVAKPLVIKIVRNARFVELEE